MWLAHSVISDITRVGSIDWITINGTRALR